MRRNTYLNFSVPHITREDIREVVRALKSGWLTTGSRAQLFENRFAEYVGAGRAVALSSGTAALFLSLVVHDIRPGDEVITSPLTFISTANVIHHLGAKPVFADIDEFTWNIDPEALEKAVTPRTKALLPVHYSGQPCEMDRIMAIAESRGLPVIEDAAHALGAEFRGRKVGGLGNLTCFSLFPTKNITTGEGGVITLDDESKARRLATLRLHGMSRDGWKRYAKEGSWFYEVHEAGYKFNLPDILAGLGLAQLQKLDRLNRKRERLVGYYLKKLADIPGIRTVKILPGMKSSWHIFPVWVDKERFGIDRNRLVEELRLRNIGTSVHFIPVHLQPFYQKNYHYKKGDFPAAEKIFEGILSLPLFPAMTRRDVDDVVQAIQDSSR